MICPKCGKDIHWRGFTLHERYCNGISKCKQCNKILDNPKSKFCSSRCAGLFNSPGRRHSEETKKKISKTLGGSGNPRPIIKCSYCNTLTTNEKYCSLDCSRKARIPTNYEKMNNKRRREIIWIEQDKKCIKCGFDLYDLKDGPYELHHIDGNRLNKKRDNEEILCCNCHFLTDNFRFKNRKHTKETRLKISESLKNNSQ